MLLPGTSVTETNFEYYILAVVDHRQSVAEDDADSFNEDNTAVMTGVYHLPAGDVFVHGTPGDDTIVILGSVTLNFNGTVYRYTSADVATFRIRSRAGADLFSGAGVAKGMRVWAGDGDDSLTGGSLCQRSAGGASAAGEGTSSVERGSSPPVALFSQYEIHLSQIVFAQICESRAFTPQTLISAIFRPPRCAS